MSPRIWFWHILGCIVSMLMGIGGASVEEWAGFERWLTRRMK